MLEFELEPPQPKKLLAMSRGRQPRSIFMPIVTASGRQTGIETIHYYNRANFVQHPEAGTRIFNLPGNPRLPHHLHSVARALQSIRLREKLQHSTICGYTARLCGQRIWRRWRGTSGCGFQAVESDSRFSREGYIYRCRAKGSKRLLDRVVTLFIAVLKEPS